MRPLGQLAAAGDEVVERLVPTAPLAERDTSAYGCGWSPASGATVPGVSWARRALFVLGVAMIGGACAPPSEPAGIDAAPRLADDHAGPARATLADAPASLRAAYIAGRQAEGAADPRFHLIADSHGVRTEPTGGLAARFDRAGVALRTEGGPEGRLETVAIRCGARELARIAGAPVVDPARPNRVTRGASATATEWYVNGPLGLEHGFDLDLAGCDRVLSVELATPGFVPTTVGVDVRLATFDGSLVLRYAELFAHDRDGQALPASFEVSAGRVVISVDVAAARGPITIDPLIYLEEQRVGPSDDGGGTANDYFGVSVALSGDTALVGAHGDTIGGTAFQGSAYVYVRSGAAWSQQAKLVAGDGAAQDFFGISVALSGETALVGALADDVGANVNQGSAYVYVRGGTTWTQQAKLVAGDGLANDRFGLRVALSGDTALVGIGVKHGAPAGGEGTRRLGARDNGRRPAQGAQETCRAARARLEARWAAVPR